MLIDIKMPALGMAQSTGTIIEWVKNVGDEIIEEETIVRIETDKSVMDLPSPSNGILKEILAEIGVPINIGVPIASIETSDNESKNQLSKKKENVNNERLDENNLNTSTSNLQNKSNIQEQKTSDTNIEIKIPEKKEDGNEVENIKKNIHSQADKSSIRILASPMSKILATNKQIKISDLLSDTNLRQPYDSSDVNKYINSNTRLYEDSQWIKAHVNLEKFNQLCHINNDSNNNEILRLELFYKICMLVVDDVLSSINGVNNDTQNVLLRALKDFEWKHYIYSNAHSKLEETSKSNCDVLFELIEDTHITDLKLSKHSKLCISLIANIEYNQSILKIDSNIKYMDEHLNLVCMKNLVKLLENPLLLLI